MSIKNNKALCTILAAFVLVTLASCNKAEETEVNETTVIETESTVDETEATVVDTEILPIQYSAVLEEIKAALDSIDDSANWDENYYDVCINALNMYYASGTSPLDSIGYALADVDNNGTSELIVGCIGYPGERTSIIRMYTLPSMEASAINLFMNGAERNSYYLLDNGHIINYASSSAFQSIFSSYEISPDGNGLNFIESYYTDIDQDNTSQINLFYTVVENDIFANPHTDSSLIGPVIDGDIDSMIPSTADYYRQCVSIELTPLSDILA